MLEMLSMALALMYFTEDKMTEIKIEHNVQTGEITEIPLSDKEIKDLEKSRAESVAAQSEAEAVAAQKAADKAALLAQLGITEEQAKLLLG